ncbi:MAG: Gfo/Idh/MocA family oxidoreductase [Planctomycetia bacterium]|nr:Gfo/Idh/MocA family oxidoreductase [Planctomycetia bacterium]
MSTGEAQRPVRWGILGAAKIATIVGRAIHNARGSQLAAIASRNLARARDWIADHTVGAPAVADRQPFLPPAAEVIPRGSYLELLQDPHIDAVYIPLPPALHCEWTCRAAEHGKHVLCEKPLALSLDEARRMADACRQSGRQLMDGVMWHHHPRTAAMKSVLESGELGPLRHVTSAFSFNALAKLQPDDIRFQHGMGGGVLGDVGWYCVTAALWAFGELPERVYATARYDRGVDISLNAILWFRGERSASFNCGFDAVWRKWLEVAGSQGTLVCDDFVNPWDAAKARFWVHGSQGQGTQHAHGGCIQEVRMIEDFGDIVRSGRLDPHWPAVALATQTVVDAIAESARQEKVVEVRAV